MYIARVIHLFVLCTMYCICNIWYRNMMWQELSLILLSKPHAQWPQKASHSWAVRVAKLFRGLRFNQVKHLSAEDDSQTSS